MKLAGDANTYGKALEAVSQQIAQLPAVQVPPQLARLDEVVSRFAHGTEVLDKTATGLIEAVGTLGVFAPAKMLRQLDDLTSDQKNHADQLQRELTRIQDGVAGVQQSVGELAREVGRQFPMVLHEMKNLGTETGDVRVSVDLLARGVAGVQASVAEAGGDLSVLSRDLRAVPGDLVTIGQAVRRIDANLGAVRPKPAAEDNVDGTPETPLPTETKPLGQTSDDLTPSLTGLLDLAGSISRDVRELKVTTETIPTTLAQTTDEVQLAAKRVDALYSLLRDPERGLQASFEKISADVHQVAEQSQGVGQLAARLRGIERVLKWHERAARAPLMRFLLLPFGRSRDGATGHAPSR
jgi:hypothetical protein